MSAMIQNDYEKEWMLPLLDIRNELDFRGEAAREADRQRRDFRRLGGHLSHYADQEGIAHIVHGPYTQQSRAHWLRRLLEAQTQIRKDKSAPEYVRQLELISLEELEEIRRIWLTEKHEVEDLVPAIYEEATGEEYPGSRSASVDLFSDELLGMLKEEFDGSRIRYEAARNLLALEKRFQKMGARRGLFKELETVLRASLFETVEEAQAHEQKKLNYKTEELS